MVAPVALVAGGEDGAGVLVGAGCDHGEVGPEFLPQRPEGTADGMGAGLDPEDGLGAGDQRAQAIEGLGREFVEHVADDEQADGFGGRKESGRGLRHV